MRKILTILILSIITLYGVSASFGVGFPTKIAIHPGESYQGQISIQNVLPDSKDMSLEIIIKEGSEYISFPEGQIIEIKKDEIKKIPIQVTIPKEINSIKEKVQLEFRPVQGESQVQGVSIVLSIGKSFDIEIIQEINNKIKFIVAILLIIAVLLIVVLFKVIKRK